MPLEGNKFVVTGMYKVTCRGKTALELLTAGNYRSVGSGIDNIVIPYHEPVDRMIYLGRFEDNVLPGHVHSFLKSNGNGPVRPTPEEALEFGCQYAQVIVDLETQYLADRSKSSFLFFPNELTIKVLGRGKYNQIVMSSVGGMLAIHLDHVTPLKKEITFAFAGDVT